MLIASIVVIALFIIFIVTVYFITIKNYQFTIDEKIIKVKNQGSKLRIYVNEKLEKEKYMPQLIKGENFSIEINDKEYQIFCISNSFGNKLRVEVRQGDKIIADNGVIIENKQKTKNDNSQIQSEKQEFIKEEENNDKKNIEKLQAQNKEDLQIENDSNKKRNSKNGRW